MTTEKFKIKPTKKPGALQVRLNENLEARYRMIATELGIGTTYTRNALTEQMHEGKLEYDLEVGKYIVTLSAPLSEVTKETMAEIRNDLKKKQGADKKEPKNKAPESDSKQDEYQEQQDEIAFDHDNSDEEGDGEISW